jgi:hypothetical protein
LVVINRPGEDAPGEGSGSQVFRWVAILEGISPDVILITEKPPPIPTRDTAVWRRCSNTLKSIIVVTDHSIQAHAVDFPLCVCRKRLTVRVHPVLGIGIVLLPGLSIAGGKTRCENT